MIIYCTNKTEAELFAELDKKARLQKQPVIHIHIASLVEKLDVTTLAFDEKSDSGLHHQHSRLSLSELEELLTKRVSDAVNNALKTLDKDLNLDND